MTRSLTSGPAIVAGSLLGFNAGGVPDYNQDAGPGVTYQGDAFPDLRFPMQKDYVSAGGVILAHSNNPFSAVIDAIPAAATTTGIAAAAAAVSGVAMTLATTSIASGGVSPGVPVVDPFSGVIRTGTVIEAGFAAGTTTAASGTIASILPTSAQPSFFAGQWLVIPNVGNAGGTTALITQVQSVGSNSIVVSPAPAASLVGARIGQANLFSNLWQGTATGLVPYLMGATGVAALLDPAASVARCVSITATNAGATGGTFAVRGLDVYGQLMLENIVHAGGATTKYGRKAFKTVLSITPAFADAQTYSAGVGDMIGIPLRSDLWEFLTLFYGGAAISASTGWIAGDQTTPSATTTDVRGQLNIGSLNNAGAGVAGGALGSSRRIVLFKTLRAQNILGSSPNNPVPLYGATQFYA